MGDFEQKDIARFRRSANRPSLDIEEPCVYAKGEEEASRPLPTVAPDLITIFVGSLPSGP
jgi:hypothetical protein